ncbi:MULTISPECIES: hypothetical protein [unclassified Paenibacillus]|uniref:Uncharacterized protein n=1 Tax=Paenibacillus provencensis TaxID=441151 RepID=A0ABW3PZ86_9BACL|nr:MULTISPECIES: hypothetical protein [unclassified Paenibacillus]MCM3130593.1 hypothetical protein [Paenibacillus sp. MER 78]SDX74980.1 hypothetical protein SAMN05518848_11381 [Paenibacillus sp. PDC88]SFS90059.1 hypothetical protein SAMN04488601_106201 [Paenibacillus sp. 453mf]
MKNALFIGSTDISDLLQYASKILTVSGKKVLLVDGTEERYIRYGTPLPNENIKVVEFEEFDVAVGFEDIKELDEYLVEHHQYESIILHFSGNKFLEWNDFQRFDHKYIATSSEKMSLDKTIRSLQTLYEETEKDEQQIQFTKIVVNGIESDLASEYLETVLGPLPIKWAEEVIELYFDEIDYSIKVNNQHEGKINIRKLSRHYKRALEDLSEALSDMETREMKAVMKQVIRRSYGWGK